MEVPTITKRELQAIVAEVVGFVEQNRSRYVEFGRGLHPEEREPVERFFEPDLLESVRIVISGPGRTPNPAFFHRARERGFHLMPDFSHLGEITFGDVIVFQSPMTDRLLFHALVHVAQYRRLGIPRYVDRYLRTFVRSGLHVLVPFEAQAFELDHRFTLEPNKPFSVAAEVERWDTEGLF